MNAAVTQLAVVQVGLLGSLTGQLGDTGNGLALPFAVLDFLLDDLRHVAMDMQVVIDLLLDEVAHILVDGVTIR